MPSATCENIHTGDDTRAVHGIFQPNKLLVLGRMYKSQKHGYGSSMESSIKVVSVQAVPWT